MSIKNQTRLIDENFSQDLKVRSLEDCYGAANRDYGNRINQTGTCSREEPVW